MRALPVKMAVLVLRSKVATTFVSARKVLGEHTVRDRLRDRHLLGPSTLAFSCMVLCTCIMLLRIKGFNDSP